MKRPCLLNADTVGVLSYCESLSNAAVLSLDNCTLENLDSLTVSLFDLSGYWCDVFQGAYYSRAIGYEDLVEWLISYRDS